MESQPSCGILTTILTPAQNIDLLHPSRSLRFSGNFALKQRKEGWIFNPWKSICFLSLSASTNRIQRNVNCSHLIVFLYPSMSIQREFVSVCDRKCPDFTSSLSLSLSLLWLLSLAPKKTLHIINAQIRILLQNHIWLSAISLWDLKLERALLR
jgi:hypothetical protein